MKKYSITSKQHQAALGGIAQIILPWPKERLGVYGSGMFDGSPVSPEASDRAMDRYVMESLEIPAGLSIVAIHAARVDIDARGNLTRFGKGKSIVPAIKVDISDTQTAAQVAGCIRERVRCQVSTAPISYALAS